MKKIKFTDIVQKLKINNVDFKSEIDKNEIFDGINSIMNAKKSELSFFSNVKYAESLISSKAKACLITEGHVRYLPKACKPIIVSNPYLAFALVTDLFTFQKNKSTGIIMKDVHLDDTCKIHANVQIDSFSSIGNNTEVFENVIIGSNTCIGPNVKIYENCVISNNVSISNAIINKNCKIKSGARIGSSGFGFEEKTKKKINHVGNVVIGENTTIGSNTTIDRAVFESTSIGEYSQIDNLVQIAHNVIIGKHAIIAAQVGIAGSTTIGDFVKIGGQSGVSGHLKLGNNVTIAGKSGVTKNIEDNKIIAGFPAKDINLWKRELIKLSKQK